MAETKVVPVPLLDLDTLVERQHVRIDGELYELVNADELSLIDFHRIARKGAKVQSMLLQETDADEADVKVLHQLLDSMCHVILLAPEEVHARLNNNHRLRVIQTFNLLQRYHPAPTAGGESEAPAEEVAPSTGESK